jgi:hypothetical protein
MSAELHVLFGAGQVGHTPAGLLLHAVKRARIVKKINCGRAAGR